MRSDTQSMIDAMKESPDNEDYWWNNEIPEEWYKSYSGTQTLPPKTAEVNPTNPTNPTGPPVKRGVPFRIEYPLEKSHACKVLMGHALVLRATEQLLGTKSFIPTWDSLVFKV